MRSLILIAGLVGCAATVEKTEQHCKYIKTIGQYTTPLLDDGAYKHAFDQAARKACGGRYRLLERSRRPSTLRDRDLPKSGGRFYWVIECVEQKELYSRGK